jgi:hypothetical protein
MGLTVIVRLLITVFMAFPLLRCDSGSERGNSQPVVKRSVAMDQAPTTLDPVQAANVYANFVIANAAHAVLLPVSCPALPT